MREHLRRAWWRVDDWFCGLGGALVLSILGWALRVASLYLCAYLVAIVIGEMTFNYRVWVLFLVLYVLSQIQGNKA